MVVTCVHACTHVQLLCNCKHACNCKVSEELMHSLEVSGVAHEGHACHAHDAGTRRIETLAGTHCCNSRSLLDFKSSARVSS